MPAFDPSTALGARALQQLSEAAIAWLTTVAADGTPKPSPFWFLWDGETILIYSQPNAPKIRNIKRHPNVSLNFDTSADGEEYLVLEGTATLQPETVSSQHLDAYVQKYDARVPATGMTWDQISREFSMGIRITPDRIRGH